MAGIMISPAAEAAVRLFTAADLPLFPTHLPSGDVDYELDCGRLIITLPPDALHASVHALFGAELVCQGQRNGYGRAFGKVGIVLSRNPDTVLGADLAFVGKAKLPVKMSREGYLATIPDLVVEIRSKNHTLAELERKAGKYLAAGVGIVLIVDPDAKTIAEHRANSEPRVIRESETLTLDEPIPGFRLNLAECFSDGS